MAMPSDLRHATPADIPVCAALLQGWLDAQEWMPRLHDLPETAGWMRARLFPENEVIVAGQPPAGFLALSPEGVVVQLVVAPAARGRGLGHALIAHAKARHPGGLTLWCFEANTLARAFYARQGFREVARTDGAGNEEGLPDILLRWGHDA